MSNRHDLERLYGALRSVRLLKNKPLVYKTRVLSGLEIRTDPADYYWHGRKRTRSQPFGNVSAECGKGMSSFIVWQYTLKGWGMFHPGGAIKPSRVEEATAFTTIVPSDDIYYLPRDSGAWTFFWLIIDHPYVIQRIRARLIINGPIWQIPPDSALVCRAIDLFRGTRSRSFVDEYAEESALFEFMLEYERFGNNLLHPSTFREELLAEMRKEVLALLSSGTPTIDQIANQRGMSRTTFTRFFKKATGLTPAAFINRVRIDEAARLLANSDLKLSAIAEMTGFADAVHFGKVFRKCYFLTPGRYRQACTQK